MKQGPLPPIPSNGPQRTDEELYELRLRMQQRDLLPQIQARIKEMAAQEHACRAERLGLEKLADDIRNGILIKRPAWASLSLHAIRLNGERPRRATKEDVEKARELHAGGISIREIGRQLGFSDTWASYWLLEGRRCHRTQRRCRYRSQHEKKAGANA